jgi:hypothetical protein
VGEWKALLYHVLLLVPLKCHHCYHKFVVSRFVTIGKTIHPPKPHQHQAPRRRSPSGTRPRRSGGHAAVPRA